MFCKIAFDIALRKTYDYKIPAAITGAQAGLRITAPFGTGNTETVGIITEIAEKTSLPKFIKLKEITKLIDEKPLFSPELSQLALFIASKWGSPEGEVLFTLIPKTFKPPKEEIKTQPFSVKQPPLPLTDAQANVIVEAGALIKENSPQPVLLYGAPKAGKTETLIRLCEQPLESGGQILFLMPDVDESNLLFENLKKRYSNCFLWNSSITQKQKNEIYYLLSQGSPCIVAGTRSAVLLPFKNLRLIAAGQEHDDNYVQEESSPLYSAIDVAAYRALYHRCPFVMASSAPSMERLKLALEEKIPSFNFKSPIEGPSEITVIFANKYGKQSSIFSDQLLNALEKTINSGQKAFLIFNRKGEEAVFACSNCGYKPQCGCGGFITKDGLCQNCEKTAKLPDACPKCGNMIFKAKPSGTQAVAAETAKFFPHAKYAVIDSNSKEEAAELWKKLSADSLDIIIGTKTALRSYNAPSTDLAAFISADTEMTLSDFRAYEKTEQLLLSARSKVKGGGALVIQTANPESYVFEAAKHGNYLEFAVKELSVRKDFGYPPYANMLRVLASAQGETEEKAQKTAASLLGGALGIVQSVAADMKIEEGTGYFVTPAKKLFRHKDGQSRAHFIIRANNYGFIEKTMRALEKTKLPKNSKLRVYNDPYSFQ